MRFLVIGLGSMGKRRIRNLHALGYDEVAGVDPLTERREYSKDKYNIQVYESFENAIESFMPSAIVISTPPDLHMHFAFKAYEHGIPAFIEASVVEAEKILELSELVTKSKSVIVPSCTMRYFPGPRKVKELVQSGVIGKVLMINYHSGQYLPNWHPWEPIESYYVSDRETGGCREIVPFELTWLNDIFGAPVPLTCCKGKLTTLGADIDDIYSCCLKYPDGVLLNLIVEVISQPFATREMRILGSQGEIVMSADGNTVKYASSDKEEWIEFELVQGTKEPGYISPEEPYIAELRDFVAAVSTGNPSRYPNSLIADYHVLQTLQLLESISEPVL